MSKEVFENIAKRQSQGLMFHSEMADYYNFLKLKGLKDFHDEQFIEECETFRCIKNYYTDKYCQTLRLNDIQPIISIIPAEWDNKTSMDIDKTTLEHLIEKSMKIYYDWEQETLNYYKEQANVLFNEECFDSYYFVRHLADNVEIEKAHLESIIIELKQVNYDINAIKNFCYKMKHK